MKTIEFMLIVFAFFCFGILIGFGNTEDWVPLIALISILLCTLLICVIKEYRGKDKASDCSD